MAQPPYTAPTQTGVGANSRDERLGEDERQSVGTLVAKLAEQASTLVKAEIALARHNIEAKAKSLATGIGIAVGGGVLALFGFGWLLRAAYDGLSLVLWPWASALIVGGVLLIAAAILVKVATVALSHDPQKASQERLAAADESAKSDRTGKGA